MEARSLIVIAVSAIVLWRRAKISYEHGVCCLVFFLVWLPHAVRISVPAIPELTVHRILILLLLAIAYRQGRVTQLTGQIPYLPVLILMLVTAAFSLGNADDPAFASKRMFAHFFEGFLLYIVILIGSWRREHCEQLLKAALAGLVLLAVFAPVERYKGVNVIGLAMPVFFDSQGVISSYQHSIHFGYAMAIGVPLALTFAHRAASLRATLLYLGAAAGLLLACYFSFSRGALVGSLLGSAIVFSLAGRRLRTMAVTLALAVMLALLLRPGLRETIGQMLDSVARAAFAPAGVADASADYRKLLWRVAWTEISASPGKLLFGLGPGATAQMDISGYFESKRGGHVMDQGFSSWDSQWAVDLVSYGVVGFSLLAYFWTRIIGRLVAAYFRFRSDPDSLLLAATIAGAIVYVWAMLTVAMFSPQLKYIAALLAASGVMMASCLAETEPEPSGMHDEDLRYSI